MNSRILVVDDEPDICFLLKDILEDEGYAVDTAEHARAANEIRQKSQPDLILLDIWMPEIDGVTLLKEWKASGIDNCPVVMMSGHGTVETAVEATKFGAYDFVEKPLSMAKLLSTVKAALSSNSRSDLSSSQRIEQPVGNSKIVQALRKKMQSLQNSTDAVFLSGSNGSGRFIWAGYLSHLSGPDTAMQALDSNQSLTDCFPLKANLYIEEISSLSSSEQTQLYRALTQSVDDRRFRIIAATHYRYDELLKNNKLLAELAEFWRDAIKIPALDEHIEDIPELLEYYVNWFGEEEQLPYRHFGVAAQNLLRNHHWQGGIAQLKRFILVVLANSDDENIELEEVRQLLRQSDNVSTQNPADTLNLSIDLNMDLRDAREVFEREYLSRHLELSGNNITELARRVGQERTHLYRKLKSLGLYSKKHA